MAELRTLKLGPFLGVDRLVRHSMFTNEEISDMLIRAELMGFDLDAPASPLEDLTLAELNILTQEAGEC